MGKGAKEKRTKNREMRRRGKYNRRDYKKEGSEEKIGKIKGRKEIKTKGIRERWG